MYFSGGEDCHSWPVSGANRAHSSVSSDLGSAAGRFSGCYKPNLHALLKILGLDVHFHRAEGDSVYICDDAGNETEVLDLVGGYGSLLLGHNHPELIAEAVSLLNSQTSNLVQGSVSHDATRLATELSQRVQIDCCAVFANSGSEAVEAAMKHALLETGGKTFLTLQGSFHGKTLGALQLTSSSLFRDKFSLSGLHVIRLDPSDERQLERAFATTRKLAGFFFEPIQGEGGVRLVSREYLHHAAELCRRHRIPFIADECQTGMGRTGTFLACQALGLKPDYVILSKALGGGLAKISALLVDRRRYKPEFDLLHSSTFAADGYSCAIALKTLELLDAATIDGCLRKGDALLQHLQHLQRKYPTVVADVRGAGLMLGLEFSRPSNDDPLMFRYFGATKLLALCVAAKLLKTHRIRVAPTLSDPWTLRVQPSALIPEDSLDRFVTALDEVLSQIAHHDIPGLTKFLYSESCSAIPSSTAVWPGSERWLDFAPARRRSRQKSSSTRRVAWLFHLVDADDLEHLEPSLELLSSRERQVFLDRLAPLVKPVVMNPVRIRSMSGEHADLYPILLPITSGWLKSQFDRRHLAELRALVQEAIDVAAALKCDVVSLGQFTSIVTQGGRRVHPRKMRITTGNSLAAALAIDSLRTALAERDINAANTTLAILGATGDIGSVCAQFLVPDFHSAILVGSGRPGSRERLQRIARTCGADASCQLNAIEGARIIVCATSCVDFPLNVDDLAHEAIVCDISIPHALDPDSISRRPDVTLIAGGILRLPFSEDLGIPGLPLPSGDAYGCLGEGLLLAWEQLNELSFTGRTSVQKVYEIAGAARRHGFFPVRHRMDDSHAFASQGGISVPISTIGVAAE